MLETPVLFLIFNRPDTTTPVFEAIRKVRPKYLFIAADGPRLDRPGEVERCRKVREIATKIDWECEVKTLFREQNLGCGRAVSGAITWFFEQVEEGIVLEDDTLPDLSFFRYCEELLHYYRSNEKVMMISGYNGIGYYESPYSYSFLVGGAVWGWATWRRAWALYDFEMTSYLAFKEEKLLNATVEEFSNLEYAFSLYDSVIGDNRVDTWDIQWNFAIHYYQSFCIWPSVNMVRNIGFDQQATHTQYKYTPAAFIKKEPITFPLQHPPVIQVDSHIWNMHQAYQQVDVRPKHIRIKDTLAKKIKLYLATFKKQNI